MSRSEPGASRGAGLALDQPQRVTQSSDGLRIDRVGLEVRAETLEDVGDQPEEDARVGHEELRLVVVADQCQSTLQYAPFLDVGDLRREVVALDPVGVVQEVQGVVDGQAEAGPPRHQPFVDLGRDADLRDLVEDFRRHGEQPDQSRPGARPEHDLQASLEREHLRIETRARDDVGQQVLDVVEAARLRHRVRQVEDLLLEQELLFVIEHAPNSSIGPWASRRPMRRCLSEAEAGRCREVGMSPLERERGVDRADPLVVHALGVDDDPAGVGDPA